jgi:hypothetical protein
MKRFARKPLLSLGLCLFGNVFAITAWAQPSGGDRAVAAQLFEDGRALLEQGHLDQACPKLEESQRLDPGGGTLLNVALCHEKQGRTATAWVEFVEARGVAKADARAPRVAFAQAHIDQLEPTLSRVTVQVPSDSDLPDLEVRRDGSVVGRAAWGTAVPVDPGDHVIEVSAPGKIPWRQSMVVGGSADSKTVVVPSLRNAPSASVAAASPPPSALHSADPSATAPSEATTVTASRPHGVSPLSVVGWASLGVGVGAAAASTYFGLHAMSLKHDADRDCPNDRCIGAGASENHDAIRSADFATGFAIAAGVGVGAGVALLITGALNHEGRATTGSSQGLGVRGVDVGGGPGAGVMTVRGQW